MKSHPPKLDVRSEIEQFLDSYCPHYYSPEDESGTRTCVLCHRIYRTWKELPRPDAIREEATQAILKLIEEEKKKWLKAE